MLEILAGMLRTAAPILLAAMGGGVFEKSGGFAIAHEGIMLFGAPRGRAPTRRSSRSASTRWRSAPPPT